MLEASTKGRLTGALVVIRRYMCTWWHTLASPLWHVVLSRCKLARGAQKWPLAPPSQLARLSVVATSSSLATKRADVSPDPVGADLQLAHKPESQSARAISRRSAAPLEYLSHLNQAFTPQSVSALLLSAPPQCGELAHRPLTSQLQPSARANYRLV